MRKEVLLLTAICFIVLSCGKNESRSVEFVPYQETDDGQWSMISPAGEVLFSEEFKNAPTVAKEGRFMVKNDEGLWEIYSADAKPKKIGGEYAYASCFEDGKALVSERNDYIKIIDLDGKELKKLDKIGNKIIDAVSAFSEGYAVYQTGEFYGAIDDSGDEIIKPDYLILYPCSDGKFIGVNKKYKKEYNKKEGKKKLTYDVLDTSGKKLFEINSEKYSNTGTRFIDGLLTVAVEKDGKECWGLINDKNEVVVKPAEKIKGISDIKGKRFVYNNGEGYGVMNLDGENIVRAKYDFLYFDVSDRLVAITEKTKNSFNYECKFIDDGDNQIGEDKYVSINPFAHFDGKHSFVKVSDRIWSIVDKDGIQIEKLPDIVNINLSFGDTEIVNDHVDFAALFSEMKLSENGVDGLTFETTPIQAVKAAIENGARSGNDKHSADDPYWYDYSDNISYFKDFSKVRSLVLVAFPGKLSRQTYRNETEYFYGYAFNRKVPSGYAFNSFHANGFAVSFTNTGKMTGKLELLLKELKAHFKKNGKLEKENNGAAVFSFSEKNRAMIYMEEDRVGIIWGDIKEAKDLDIEKYKNTKEKINIDQSVIQNVNGSGSPISLAPADNDTIEEVVDTVAVDY
jgi:hypothetical protein